MDYTYVTPGVFRFLHKSKRLSTKASTIVKWLLRRVGPRVPRLWTVRSVSGSSRTLTKRTPSSVCPCSFDLVRVGAFFRSPCFVNQKSWGNRSMNKKKFLKNVLSAQHLVAASEVADGLSADVLKTCLLRDSPQRKQCKVWLYARTHVDTQYLHMCGCSCAMHHEECAVLFAPRSILNRLVAWSEARRQYARTRDKHKIQTIILS